MFVGMRQSLTLSILMVHLEQLHKPTLLDNNTKGMIMIVIMIMMP